MRMGKTGNRAVTELMLCVEPKPLIFTERLATFAPCNFCLATRRCDSTVRYLGVELEDAMSIAERIRPMTSQRRKLISSPKVLDAVSCTHNCAAPIIDTRVGKFGLDRVLAVFVFRLTAAHHSGRSLCSHNFEPL